MSRYLMFAQCKESQDPDESMKIAASLYETALEPNNPLSYFVPSQFFLSPWVGRNGTTRSDPPFQANHQSSISIT